MRKILGMVIMTGREYAEELKIAKKHAEELGFRDGAEAARKGLDKDTRRFMRELGFLNVTDDFWKDKGLIGFIAAGFDWAFPTPQIEQKYMPFHEREFYGKTQSEIRHMALEAQSCIRL